ncbi:ABC transporter substrate-binding protein [Klebsiella pneumoniae]|uniref:ABC transporter substrate-binding protein n=1 Tax=Klebsiella pneumoniae TaxID=573 RepID=A0A939NTI7_KLEPN|nr:ABC transporter substrate-binding protein [Klebsiella pneumoniae]
MTDLGGLKRLIDRSAPGSYLRPYLSYRHPCHVAYYWLASAGIDPFNDAHRRGAAADGDEHAHRQYERLCVGEPWNARAINDRIGFTAATSGISGPSIRKGAGHPSRLGGTQRTPPRAGGGLMEAQRWIAASPENTRETAACSPDAAGSIPGAIPHRPDAWRV